MSSRILSSLLLLYVGCSIEAFHTPISSPLRTSTQLAVTRRQALEGVALSTFVLSSGSNPSYAANGKTILITGANSGIGFEAIQRLAMVPSNNIILACRTKGKAQAAISTIQSQINCQANLIPAECDLASKASIASFAKTVPSLLQQPLDVLCLNAGLARNTEAKDVARTQDGFELTVGTNHFGHFYLQHNLLPHMASDSRIVVTASGVHDPASPGGAQGVPATLGNLSGLEQMGASCEMVDGGSFNADKAYKDSKLCNVLYTRELQRRLNNNDKTQRMTANCFNPGLIVGTNFFRDQNPIFTKVFDVAATNLLKVGETPAFGGGCLAYMTDVATKGSYYTSPPGSVKYGDAAYGNQFTVSPVSVEARDDAKAQKLWELTEKALGIS